jgi:hypothetical protein
MKRWFGILLAVSGVMTSLAAAPSFGAATLNTAQIDAATGLKGTLNVEENVYKVTSPRNDVQVSVDGWTMPPFMGLTTWAAFAPGKKDDFMVMGDFVLMPDEVNPVMSAALDNGLEVTALHNHFFYDEPRVFFMHIGGEGTEQKLASAVGKMLATVKNIRSVSATPAKGFGSRIASTNAITSAPIEGILGKGQSKDGMFKVVLGRKTKMKCDCEAGKEMGVNTWAAFAGTDQQAVVDGDFAMAENELQGVLKALRSAKINVVAIHNHMTGETPKIVFLHYWGTGSALDLARGVKSAIDSQKKGG